MQRDTVHGGHRWPRNDDETSEDGETRYSGTHPCRLVASFESCRISPVGRWRATRSFFTMAFVLVEILWRVLVLIPAAGNSRLSSAQTSETTKVCQRV